MRPAAQFVYRGDSRGPQLMFPQGFQAFGTNYDLPNHLRNGPDSGYVASSFREARAADFAYLAAAGAWQANAGVWVYTIELIGSPNEVFLDATMYASLIVEHEIAFRDGIPTHQILSAQLWDLVNLPDGSAEYRPVGPVIHNWNRP